MANVAAPIGTFPLGESFGPRRVFAAGLVMMNLVRG